MVDDRVTVEVPLDEFHRLTHYKQINHQCRAAISYSVSARCHELYGYPDGPEGYGFDTNPLPNDVFPWLVYCLTGGARSPQVENGELDIGLTGPGTLAGDILTELCRRLMIHTRRQQNGRINAGRTTEHREV